MTSQLAQVTPIDRRPLAYNTGPVTAVRVWNPTAFNVRAILGGQLYDIIPAGKDAIYNVANLSGYAGWVLLVPATPVPGSQLAGQIVVTTYGNADVLPSGAISQQSDANYQPNMANPDPILDSLRGALSFNVRMFGARGDGVTDDRAAIQACLDACRICGGGDVFLPAGTYLTGTSTTVTTNTGLNAGLAVGSYTTLRGAGPHSTTIKLAASSPNQTYHVVNYQEAGPGGDIDITVRDLALDGNGANQPGTVDGQYGLGVFFASRILFENVHSHDYLGTTQGGNGPNGTAGESWCFGANNCADVTMIACEAYGASGSTTVAAGFSNNYVFNLRMANCVAHDTYHSHGMTHWNCNHVSYTGCSAWKCGGTGTIAGFNSEISNYVSYEGCMSGGLTPGAQAGTYSSGTNLGNYSYGYRILSGTFHSYNGCQSYGNPYGLYLDSTSGAISEVYLHGCLFNQGSQWGVYANSGYTVGTISIPGSNRITNFTAGVISLNGQTAFLNALQFPAPSMPASGTTYNSPFPFPCAVTIYGGTVTVVTVNGTQALAGPGTVVVPRLGSITLTYSAAPTWQWYGM